jgi:subtilisin family serine protease
MTHENQNPVARIYVLLVLLALFTGAAIMALRPEPEAEPRHAVSVEPAPAAFAGYPETEWTVLRQIVPDQPSAEAAPAAPPAAGKPVPKGGKDGIAGEYVFSFFDSRDRDAFIEAAKQKGAVILGVIDIGNSVRIKINSSADLDALLREGPVPVAYSSNVLVYHPRPVERAAPVPDGIYRPFGGTALNWLGVSADSDAWGRGVKVAILDTGGQQHDAISEKNLTRIDMLGGAVQESVSRAHGTAVTSIIAGQMEDIRGIAPGAELLSIRVIPEGGQGDAFTLAQGIMEAVNRNASIINVCLTSYGDCHILKQAVEYAVQRGVIIVASAGNDGSADPAYPAAYDGVLGVGAVDAMGQRLYFSNIDKSVGLMAPGLSVTAAGPDNTSVLFSGTSAAAPFVSGALAALLSQNNSLTPADAAALAVKYTNDGGLPGEDPLYGAGILDIRRLQERTEDGVFDVALADVVLTGGATNGPRAVITVQNRGTAVIPQSTLRVMSGDVHSSFLIENLKPCETKSFTLEIRPDAYDANGVSVLRAAVAINGMPDSYPENNSCYIRFLRPQ